MPRAQDCYPLLDLYQISDEQQVILTVNRRLMMPLGTIEAPSPKLNKIRPFDAGAFRRERRCT
jgi:hypothetical protein